MADSKINIDDFKTPVDSELHEKLKTIGTKEKNELIELIYDLLKQAATTEHLLSMQYLFTCFSLKKYPEEFDDYRPGATDPGQLKINNIRMAQIEVIRRWEANILMVAREEMTHLCYVNNMLAIINKPPFLFRPNFPVPANSFPLNKPVNLMPFSQFAIEVYRYWEKPNHLKVPDPLMAPGLPEHLKPLFEAMPHANVDDTNIDNENDKAKKNLSDFIDGKISSINHKTNESFDPNHTIIEAKKILLDLLNHKLDNKLRVKIKNPLIEGSHFRSIESLYFFIKTYFELGLTNEIFEGQNMERIVDEHFGFNMALNPLILGQYNSYVQQAIQQIIEEGEGVWGVPPPLGSHFWVFQKILDELAIQNAKSRIGFNPSLPVAFNPAYAENTTRHLVRSMEGNNPESITTITNPVAKQAMTLFNQAYNVMLKMLYGFFADYSIDQTTGIRPPIVNAYFQTAFYPFMTNIIRPLGELICRLPAKDNFVPNGGKVPDITAGPDFLIDMSQLEEELRSQNLKAYDTLTEYLNEFNQMKTTSIKLAADCKRLGYHIANYQQPDARDFDVCFNYLAECFDRISKNFEAYWNGQLVAPVSSKGFQNYSDTYN